MFQLMPLLLHHFLLIEIQKDLPFCCQFTHVVGKQATEHLSDVRKLVFVVSMLNFYVEIYVGASNGC